MLLLAALPAAVADPADYVHTPRIERGETEIDFKAGALRRRDDRSEAGTTLGIGHAFTDRFSAELVAIRSREAAERSRLEGWELETRLHLVDADDGAPLDLGLLLEIERPRERSEGYGVVFGPLLQLDRGALRANLNLLFARRLNADEPAPTELAYRWQLMWRRDAPLTLGAQGFGELGRWDHWAPRSRQSHRLGPALFGRVPTGDNEAIEINAALLFGTGGAAPRRTLRMQASFGF